METLQGFRLSPHQRRLWRLLADGVEDRVRCSFLLEGRLDRGLLEAALEAVFARHEILRTSFHCLAGMKVPIQRIEDRSTPRLEGVDLQGLSPGEQEAEIERRLAAPGSGDPAARAALAALAADRHLLLLELPALCADARSFGILLREIGQAYGGSLPEADADEVLQYADFAEWQNDLLEGEDAPEGRAYWQGLTASAADALALGERRSARGDGGFGSIAAAVDPETVRGLDRAAAELGAPLGALLTAAWQTLLWRLGGAPADVLIGRVSDGRKYEDLQGAVGLFSRCLPCRTPFEPSLGFDRVVERVDRAAGEGEAWQEYFAASERGKGGQDGEAEIRFAAGFELEEHPAPATVRGLRLSLHRLRIRTEPFEIALTCRREAGDLRIELRYDRGLYEDAAAARICERLAALLASVARDPRAPVEELEILGARERTLLRGALDGAVAGLPAGCIHELFEAQARRTPERTAIIAGSREVGYGELNRRANQLAHLLRGEGAGPEVTVGLAFERSPEMVIGLLGALKSGAAYVPLDLESPQSRLDYVLRDARVAVLVTEERLLAALPPFAGRVICLDRDRERLEREPAGDPAPLAHADNLAYITYTSGSTGRPKGVLSTHRGAVSYLDFITRQYGVGRLATVLQMAAFSFDASVRDIVGPLLTGARILLVEGSAAKEPAALLAAIRKHSVDGILSLVPTMFRALVQAARESDLPYGSVRLLLLSGEALHLSDIRQARRVFGEGVEVVNQYGPTECTMTSSFWPVPADSAATAAVAERGLVPIGRPIQNLRFRLLDRHLAPVPVGVAGEVCIGGAGVTRGYLGLPATTAERFVPDPEGEGPGERLFRTGDLARYRADGELELLGRGDRQVKVRGVRIELDEVEALLSEHRDLREAAVVLAAEEGREARLVAYVVPGAQRPSAGDLRAFLQERLPGSMIPALFIPLQGLPRTRTGKVDRGALPAPDPVRPGLSEEAALPRTQVEELLAVVWRQVLGVEEAGIRDNFFESGGHSLLAAQFVARVQDVFRVELPLRSIFEAPTIEQLARVVEQATQAGQHLPAPAGERADRSGPLPVSFAQQRLWFLQQLDPETYAFNIPRAVRLSGTLDVAALELAMSEIVRRHEALRTTFVESAGDPLQVIVPPRREALPVIDLSGLPEAEKEAGRLAFESSRRPFDLTTGPLLRVALVRLGASEHLFLFTIHHIVSDDWSMRVLIRELSALYQAFSRGEPSPLPELPLQYADFAWRQRLWLSGEALEGHLGFWRRKLAGELPVLDLPFARPRRSDPGYGGARQSFVLPPDLTRTLQALSRGEGVTLFMTLLAAFQTLLHRYTGREDIVVGTDIANRTRVDIEPLIGFFVNLLVLRTDLGGDPTFRELLARVREVALDAYAHQDLPFEKLVEELQPERTPGRAPLFQYLLVLQDPRRQRLELPGLTLETLEIDNRTSKFDLVLVLLESEQGLTGIWNYSTDLFDVAAIARLSGHLENLLASAAAQPDARLSQLEFLAASERGQQKMEKSQRKETSFAKFMNVQPKALKVSGSSLVTMEPLVPGQKLPLLVRPAGGAVDLVDWARGNRDVIEKSLLDNGAILFRGFDLDSVARFEELARAICPELFGEYGDLPRDAVAGKIYSSTPYPPDRTIWFHNESSQLDQWPLKQWFFCVQPAREGGETPIVDCRKIYELLDPEVRDRFARLGVMYVRNYTEGLDVSWRDFFQTSDRSVVEEFCRRSSIQVEWKADGGLRTRKICPAVARHPKTGEMLFFNQIQAHHVSCLAPEDRESLLQLFALEDLPRNVYYGDGSPIEDSVMQKIVETYRSNAVTFPWQKGDLVMVDNMLVAHGRYPFAGPRKIVVAMGEMVSISDISSR